jgi:peptide/nickel transport system permease protein
MSLVVSSFFGNVVYAITADVGLAFLGFELKWFPIAQSYSDKISPSWSWGFIGNILYHLVMPAGTIILISAGGWPIGMRSTMASVLAEDYIIMAEAKGLSQWRVMFQYAMRNAILPNVTQPGMSIGFILSGQSWRKSCAERTGNWSRSHEGIFE